MISEIFETEKGTQCCECRTICEVHREMYDICVLEFHDRPAQLRRVVKLLEESFVMGVKMNQRLVEQKIGMTFESNTNFDKSMAAREDRIRLTKVLGHNRRFLKRYA